MMAPGVQAGSGRGPRTWQPSCFVGRPSGNSEAGGDLASAVINGGGLGVRGGADDDADRAGADEGAAAVGVGGLASATDGDAVAGVVAEGARDVGGLALAVDSDAAAGLGAVAAGGGAPPPQAAIKVRAARTTEDRVRIRRRYQSHGRRPFAGELCQQLRPDDPVLVAAIWTNSL
jgi:hypothetical protein